MENKLIPGILIGAIVGGAATLVINQHVTL